MPDRLVPDPSDAPRNPFMPRRAQQRPHRCPTCGSALEWEARTRVEQFSWDHFHCPQGCGRFYQQTGSHFLQSLD
jgi:hypothetical protein